MKSELTLKYILEDYLKKTRPKRKKLQWRKVALVKTLAEIGFIHFRGKKLNLILQKYKTHHELLFVCSCGHPCRKFYLPELTCLKCNKQLYKRYPKTPLGRIQMYMDRAIKYPNLSNKYLEKAYSHVKILKQKIKA